MDRQKPHYKSGQLICKLLDYFKFDNIKVIYSEDYNTTVALKSFGHPIQNLGHENAAKDGRISFIFIACLNHQNKSIIENLLKEPQKETLILVRNIRRDKQTFDNWNRLKKNKSLTISVDTFYHGILCHRHGKVKEHFKIRL